MNGCFILTVIRVKREGYPVIHLACLALLALMVLLVPYLLHRELSITYQGICPSWKGMRGSFPPLPEHLLHFSYHYLP